MSATIWLYLAAAFSAFTCLLHLIGGGRTTARPLLDSDLNQVAKYTNYYTWHVVSIILGAMAVVYGLAARGTVSAELPLAATILATLFALWSGILTIWKKQKIITLPQWILFLPIAVAGFLGTL